MDDADVKTASDNICKRHCIIKAQDCISSFSQEIDDPKVIIISWLPLILSILSLVYFQLLSLFLEFLFAERQCDRDI